MNIELIINNTQQQLTVVNNNPGVIIDVTNNVTNTIELINGPVNNIIEIIDSPIGIKGDSPYDIAVRNGYVGTEQQWYLNQRTIDWGSTNW